LLLPFPLSPAGRRRRRAAGGGGRAGLPPPPERVSRSTPVRTIGPALPARIHATAKNLRCGRHHSRLPGLVAIDRSIDQPINRPCDRSATSSAQSAAGDGTAAGCD
jgi:hypothetical protein